METLHENKREPLLDQPDSYIIRIEDYSEIRPVVKLIREAPEGELGFSAADFLWWAGRKTQFIDTLLLLGKEQGEAAGFLIAFAPWELEKGVYVFQAYIAPKWRGKTRLLRMGVACVRAWARHVGAKDLNFETNRPRAWNRLLDSVVKTKLRRKV